MYMKAFTINTDWTATKKVANFPFKYSYFFWSDGFNLLMNIALVLLFAFLSPLPKSTAWTWNKLHVSEC